jgi:putative colanic acid biosynthesis acetyltransferase WcaB
MKNWICTGSIAETMAGIFQDWKANKGNPKGRIVLCFFRLCQGIRRAPFWPLGLPVLGLYVVLIHWIMGIELDYKSDIGPGLALHHGMKLVVHHKVKIGAGCVLRQFVTIGEKAPGGPVPVLGERVEVGANAVILGGIHLGDESVIGAGSVVLHDVPPRAVVAGNPAQVLRLKP